MAHEHKWEPNGLVLRRKIYLKRSTGNPTGLLVSQNLTAAQVKKDSRITQRFFQGSLS